MKEGNKSESSESIVDSEDKYSDEHKTNRKSRVQSARTLKIGKKSERNKKKLKRPKSGVGRNKSQRKTLDNDDDDAIFESTKQDIHSDSEHGRYEEDPLVIERLSAQSDQANSTDTRQSPGDKQRSTGDSAIESDGSSSPVTARQMSATDRGKKRLQSANRVRSLDSEILDTASEFSGKNLTKKFKNR